ncbi:SDR family NAD(P)-dependent oxidoreductase [Streptomyces sp. NPDC005776]|uniref:SDR family NAD(P)-dependent oxidoreductase n=1 Tax=Streptomyces sp. NPDC005776 TaxID=3154676 RepID=UPI0033F405C0
MRPPSSASGKVAIVVGGGSGIGAARVREFAANGYRVVTMSPSGRARALAESLGGAGLDGSNTSTEDLRACVGLTVSRYGRVETAGSVARPCPADHVSVAAGESRWCPVQDSVSWLRYLQ